MDIPAGRHLTPLHMNHKRYNFQKANQKNVLTALAAYFIVCNRIYDEICEISAAPKKLLKSKLFIYEKNVE